jgi:adenylate kinase
VLLLGGPGSGKSVQADLTSRALGLPHIASGELLRAHVARRTPLGQAAREYMQRGDLLPDELVSDIVLQRLGEDDAARGALLDGFPRTPSQAQRLDHWLAEHHGHIASALYLDVPPEVLLERMASRQRADDQPAVAAKRVEESAADQAALVARYQPTRIDGHRPVDEVHQDIIRVLGRAD